ncbi:ABC transporter substrate-binding protein [Bordetella sp. BOR01]|uniref:ABC transporter substrate-binding protein n=1 Tax=Bordetella sp. BOR01 TaxID=2854779 RepID=UPI001C457780|nr:ABC transporter substrate-binding protein [Bordetella sp. BOR01]MBV7485311.1 ABC transporter substrate-binding protein [Bordetella sp. BOR01]
MKKHDAQHHSRTAGSDQQAGVPRRTVLKAVAAAGLAGWAPFVRAQSRTLTVTCWGGSYEAAVRSAFVEPFAKEKGVTVTLVNSADLTRMKVQVQSKNVSWDVFDSIGPQIMAGSREGLWEAVDTSRIDGGGLVQKPGKDHVSTYFYAGGIGFDPKRFPDGKHPTTFKELWDVQKFPGRRGLRSRVSENLEMALLADGVAPDALYPLDIERAFKSMDRIKDAVRKWIETTPETVTLLANNEVDFSYTYLSRVLPAQRNGQSVQMSLAQTLNSFEYLAVPKHGRNTQLAMDYIAFCLRPDRQAAFCEMVEFSPNALAALDSLSPAARARIPDMKDPNSIIVDDAWWGEHYEALQRRFTEWMLM